MCTDGKLQMSSPGTGHGGLTCREAPWRRKPDPVSLPALSSPLLPRFGRRICTSVKGLMRPRSCDGTSTFVRCDAVVLRTCCSGEPLEDRNKWQASGAVSEQV